MKIFYKSIILFIVAFIAVVGFSAQVQAAPGDPCKADADCDEGLCIVGETCCPQQKICVAGTPVYCGDQLCNPDDGTCVDCLFWFDCDDDLFCNGEEECEDNICVAGTDPCAVSDICYEEGEICEPFGCTDNKDCDDDLFCNGDEECVDNVCVTGTDPCAEGEICFEDHDYCVFATRCVNDADCDDGDPCTNEFCMEPECVVTEVDCGPDLICREDDGSCVDCLVDDHCAGGGICEDGVCVDECPEIAAWDADENCLLSKRELKGLKDFFKTKHKAEKTDLKESQSEDKQFIKDAKDMYGE